MLLLCLLQVVDVVVNGDERLLAGQAASARNTNWAQFEHQIMRQRGSTIRGVDRCVSIC